ncbi:hypothetical protein ACFL4S_00125 [bacterium]
MDFIKKSRITRLISAVILSSFIFTFVLHDYLTAALTVQNFSASYYQKKLNSYNSAIAALGSYESSIISQNAQGYIARMGRMYNDQSYNIERAAQKKTASMKDTMENNIDSVRKKSRRNISSAEKIHQETAVQLTNAYGAQKQNLINRFDGRLSDIDQMIARYQKLYAKASGIKDINKFQINTAKGLTNTAAGLIGAALLPVTAVSKIAGKIGGNKVENSIKKPFEPAYDYREKLKDNADKIDELSTGKVKRDDYVNSIDERLKYFMNLKTEMTLSKQKSLDAAEKRFNDTIDTKNAAHAKELEKINKTEESLIQNMMQGTESQIKKYESVVQMSLDSLLKEVQTNVDNFLFSTEKDSKGIYTTAIEKAEKSPLRDLRADADDKGVKHQYIEEGAGGYIGDVQKYKQIDDHRSVYQGNVYLEQAKSALGSGAEDGIDRAREYAAAAGLTNKSVDIVMPMQFQGVNFDQGPIDIKQKFGQETAEIDAQKKGYKDFVDESAEKILTQSEQMIEENNQFADEIEQSINEAGEQAEGTLDEQMESYEEETKRLTNEDIKFLNEYINKLDEAMNIAWPQVSAKFEHEAEAWQDAVDFVTKSRNELSATIITAIALIIAGIAGMAFAVGAIQGGWSLAKTGFTMATAAAAAVITIIIGWAMVGAGIAGIGAGVLTFIGALTGIGFSIASVIAALGKEPQIQKGYETVAGNYTELEKELMKPNEDGTKSAYNKFVDAQDAFNGSVGEFDYRLKMAFRVNNIKYVRDLITRVRKLLGPGKRGEGLTDAQLAELQKLFYKFKNASKDKFLERAMNNVKSAYMAKNAALEEMKKTGEVTVKLKLLKNGKFVEQKITFKNAYEAYMGQSLEGKARGMQYWGRVMGIIKGWQDNPGTRPDGLDLSPKIFGIKLTSTKSGKWIYNNILAPMGDFAHKNIIQKPTEFLNKNLTKWVDYSSSGIKGDNIFSNVIRAVERLVTSLTKTLIRVPIHLAGLDLSSKIFGIELTSTKAGKWIYNNILAPMGDFAHKNIIQKPTEFLNKKLTKWLDYSGNITRAVVRLVPSLIKTLIMAPVQLGTMVMSSGFSFGTGKFTDALTGMAEGLAGLALGLAEDVVGIQKGAILYNIKKTADEKNQSFWERLDPANLIANLNTAFYNVFVLNQGIGRIERDKSGKIIGYRDDAMGKGGWTGEFLNWGTALGTVASFAMMGMDPFSIAVNILTLPIKLLKWAVQNVITAIVAAAAVTLAAVTLIAITILKPDWIKKGLDFIANNKIAKIVTYTVVGTLAVTALAYFGVKTIWKFIRQQGFAKTWAGKLWNKAFPSSIKTAAKTAKGFWGKAVFGLKAAGVIALTPGLLLVQGISKAVHSFFTKNKVGKAIVNKVPGPIKTIGRFVVINTVKYFAGAGKLAAKIWSKGGLVNKALAGTIAVGAVLLAPVLVPVYLVVRLATTAVKAVKNFVTKTFSRIRSFTKKGYQRAGLNKLKNTLKTQLEKQGFTKQQIKSYLDQVTTKYYNHLKTGGKIGDFKLSLPKDITGMTFKANQFLNLSDAVSTGLTKLGAWDFVKTNIGGVLKTAVSVLTPKSLKFAFNHLKAYNKGIVKGLWNKGIWGKAASIPAALGNLIAAPAAAVGALAGSAVEGLIALAKATTAVGKITGKVRETLITVGTIILFVTEPEAAVALFLSKFVYDLLSAREPKNPERERAKKMLKNMIQKELMRGFWDRILGRAKASKAELKKLGIKGNLKAMFNQGKILGQQELILDLDGTAQDRSMIKGLFRGRELNINGKPMTYNDFMTNMAKGTLSLDSLEIDTSARYGLSNIKLRFNAQTAGSVTNSFLKDYLSGLKGAERNAFKGVLKTYLQNAPKRHAAKVERYSSLVQQKEFLAKYKKETTLIQKRIAKLNSKIDKATYDTDTKKRKYEQELKGLEEIASERKAFLGSLNRKNISETLNTQDNVKIAAKQRELISEKLKFENEQLDIAQNSLNSVDSWLARKTGRSWSWKKFRFVKNEQAAEARASIKQITADKQILTDLMKEHNRVDAQYSYSTARSALQFIVQEQQKQMQRTDVLNNYKRNFIGEKMDETKISNLTEALNKRMQYIKEKEKLEQEGKLSAKAIEVKLREELGFSPEEEQMINQYENMYGIDFQFEMYHRSAQDQASIQMMLKDMYEEAKVMYAEIVLDISTLKELSEMGLRTQIEAFEHRNDTVNYLEDLKRNIAKDGKIKQLQKAREAYDSAAKELNDLRIKGAYRQDIVNARKNLRTALKALKHASISAKDYTQAIEHIGTALKSLEDGNLQNKLFNEEQLKSLGGIDENFNEKIAVFENVRADFKSKIAVSGIDLGNINISEKMFNMAKNMKDARYGELKERGRYDYSKAVAYYSDRTYRVQNRLASAPDQVKADLRAQLEDALGAQKTVRLLQALETSFLKAKFIGYDVDFKTFLQKERAGRSKDKIEEEIRELEVRFRKMKALKPKLEKEIKELEAKKMPEYGTEDYDVFLESMKTLINLKKQLTRLNTDLKNNTKMFQQEITNLQLESKIAETGMSADRVRQFVEMSFTSRDMLDTGNITAETIDKFAQRFRKIETIVNKQVVTYYEKVSIQDADTAQNAVNQEIKDLESKMNIAKNLIRDKKNIDKDEKEIKGAEDKLKELKRATKYFEDEIKRIKQKQTDENKDYSKQISELELNLQVEKNRVGTEVTLLEEMITKFESEIKGLKDNIEQQIKAKVKFEGNVVLMSSDIQVIKELVLGSTKLTENAKIVDIVNKYREALLKYKDTPLLNKYNNQSKTIRAVIVQTDNIYDIMHYENMLKTNRAFIQKTMYQIEKHTEISKFIDNRLKTAASGRNTNKTFNNMTKAVMNFNNRMSVIASMNQKVSNDAPIFRGDINGQKVTLYSLNELRLELEPDTFQTNIKKWWRQRHADNISNKLESNKKSLDKFIHGKSAKKRAGNEFDTLNEQIIEKLLNAENLKFEELQTGNIVISDIEKLNEQDMKLIKQIQSQLTEAGKNYDAVKKETSRLTRLFSSSKRLKVKQAARKQKVMDMLNKYLRMRAKQKLETQVQKLDALKDNIIANIGKKVTTGVIQNEVDRSKAVIEKEVNAITEPKKYSAEIRKLRKEIQKELSGKKINELNIEVLILKTMKLQALEQKNANKPINLTIDNVKEVFTRVLNGHIKSVTGSMDASLKSNFVDISKAENLDTTRTGLAQALKKYISAEGYFGLDEIQRTAPELFKGGEPDALTRSAFLDKWTQTSYFKLKPGALAKQTIIADRENVTEIFSQDVMKILKANGIAENSKEYKDIQDALKNIDPKQGEVKEFVTALEKIAKEKGAFQLDKDVYNLGTLSEEISRIESKADLSKEESTFLRDMKYVRMIEEFKFLAERAKVSKNASDEFLKMNKFKDLWVEQVKIECSSNEKGFVEVLKNEIVKSDPLIAQEMTKAADFKTLSEVIQKQMKNIADKKSSEYKNLQSYLDQVKTIQNFTNKGRIKYNDKSFDTAKKLIDISNKITEPTALKSKQFEFIVKLYTTKLNNAILAKQPGAGKLKAQKSTEVEDKMNAHREQLEKYMLKGVVRSAEKSLEIRNNAHWHYLKKFNALVEQAAGTGKGSVKNMTGKQVIKALDSKGYTYDKIIKQLYGVKNVEELTPLMRDTFAIIARKAYEGHRDYEKIVRGKKTLVKMRDLDVNDSAFKFTQDLILLGDALDMGFIGSKSAGGGKTGEFQNLIGRRNLRGARQTKFVVAAKQEISNTMNYADFSRMFFGTRLVDATRLKEKGTLAEEASKALLTKEKVVFVGDMTFWGHLAHEMRTDSSLKVLKLFKDTVCDETDFLIMRSQQFIQSKTVRAQSDLIKRGGVYLEALNQVSQNYQVELDRTGQPVFNQKFVKEIMKHINGNKRYKKWFKGIKEGQRLYELHNVARAVKEYREGAVTGLDKTDPVNGISQNVHDGNDHNIIATQLLSKFGSDKFNVEQFETQFGKLKRFNATVGQTSAEATALDILAPDASVKGSFICGATATAEDAAKLARQITGEVRKVEQTAFTDNPIDVALVMNGKVRIGDELVSKKRDMLDFIDKARSFRYGVLVISGHEELSSDVKDVFKDLWKKNFKEKNKSYTDKEYKDFKNQRDEIIKNLETAVKGLDRVCKITLVKGMKGQKAVDSIFAKDKAYVSLEKLIKDNVVKYDNNKRRFVAVSDGREIGTSIMDILSSETACKNLGIKDNVYNLAKDIRVIDNYTDAYKVNPIATETHDKQYIVLSTLKSGRGMNFQKENALYTKGAESLGKAIFKQVQGRIGRGDYRDFAMRRVRIDNVEKLQKNFKSEIEVLHAQKKFYEQDIKKSKYNAGLIKDNITGIDLEIQRLQSYKTKLDTYIDSKGAKGFNEVNDYSKEMLMENGDIISRVNVAKASNFQMSEGFINTVLKAPLESWKAKAGPSDKQKIQKTIDYMRNKTAGFMRAVRAEKTLWDNPDQMFYRLMQAQIKAVESTYEELYNGSKFKMIKKAMSRFTGTKTFITEKIKNKSIRSEIAKGLTVISDLKKEIKTMQNQSWTDVVAKSKENIRAYPELIAADSPDVIRKAFYTTLSIAENLRPAEKRVGAESYAKAVRIDVPSKLITGSSRKAVIGIDATDANAVVASVERMAGKKVRIAGKKVKVGAIWLDNEQMHEIAQNRINHRDFFKAVNKWGIKVIVGTRNAIESMDQRNLNVLNTRKTAELLKKYKDTYHDIKNGFELKDFVGQRREVIHYDPAGTVQKPEGINRIKALSANLTRKNVMEMLDTELKETIGTKAFYGDSDIAKHVLNNMDEQDLTKALNEHTRFIKKIRYKMGEEFNIEQMSKQGKITALLDKENNPYGVGAIVEEKINSEIGFMSREKLNEYAKFMYDNPVEITVNITGVTEKDDITKFRDIIKGNLKGGNIKINVSAKTEQTQEKRIFALYDSYPEEEEAEQEPAVPIGEQPAALVADVHRADREILAPEERVSHKIVLDVTRDQLNEMIKGPDEIEDEPVTITLKDQEKVKENAFARIDKAVIPGTGEKSLFIVVTDQQTDEEIKQLKKHVLPLAKKSKKTITIVRSVTTKNYDFGAETGEKEQDRFEIIFTNDTEVYEKNEQLKDNKSASVFVPMKIKEKQAKNVFIKMKHEGFVKEYNQVKQEIADIQNKMESKKVKQEEKIEYYTQFREKSKQIEKLEHSISKGALAVSVSRVLNLNKASNCVVLEVPEEKFMQEAAVHAVKKHVKEVYESSGALYGPETIAVTDTRGRIIDVFKKSEPETEYLSRNTQTEDLIESEIEIDAEKYKEQGEKYINDMLAQLNTADKTKLINLDKLNNRSRKKVLKTAAQYLKRKKLNQPIAFKQNGVLVSATDSELIKRMEFWKDLEGTVISARAGKLKKAKRPVITDIFDINVEKKEEKKEFKKMMASLSSQKPQKDYFSQNMFKEQEFLFEPVHIKNLAEDKLKKETETKELINDINDSTLMLSGSSMIVFDTARQKADNEQIKNNLKKALTKNNYGKYSDGTVTIIEVDKQGEEKKEKLNIWSKNDKNPSRVTITIDANSINKIVDKDKMKEVIDGLRYEEVQNRRRDKEIDIIMPKIESLNEKQVLNALKAFTSELKLQKKVFGGDFSHSRVNIKNRNGNLLDTTDKEHTTVLQHKDIFENRGVLIMPRYVMAGRAMTEEWIKNAVHNAEKDRVIIGLDKGVARLNENAEQALKQLLEQGDIAEEITVVNNAGEILVTNDTVIRTAVNLREEQKLGITSAFIKEMSIDKHQKEITLFGARVNNIVKDTLIKAKHEFKDEKTINITVNQEFVDKEQEMQNLITELNNNFADKTYKLNVYNKETNSTTELWAQPLFEKGVIVQTIKTRDSLEKLLNHINAGRNKKAYERYSVLLNIDKSVETDTKFDENLIEINKLVKNGQIGRVTVTVQGEIVATNDTGVINFLERREKTMPTASIEKLFKKFNKSTARLSATIEKLNTNIKKADDKYASINADNSLSSEKKTKELLKITDKKKALDEKLKKATALIVEMRKKSYIKLSDSIIKGEPNQVRTDKIAEIQQGIYTANVDTTFVQEDYMLPVSAPAAIIATLSGARSLYMTRHKYIVKTGTIKRTIENVGSFLRLSSFRRKAIKDTVTAFTQLTVISNKLGKPLTWLQNKQKEQDIDFLREIAQLETAA